MFELEQDSNSLVQFCSLLIAIFNWTSGSDRVHLIRTESQGHFCHSAVTLLRTRCHRQSTALLSFVVTSLFICLSTHLRFNVHTRIHHPYGRSEPLTTTECLCAYFCPFLPTLPCCMVAAEFSVSSSFAPSLLTFSTRVHAYKILCSVCLFVSSCIRTTLDSWLIALANLPFSGQVWLPDKPHSSSMGTDAPWE